MKINQIEIAVRFNEIDSMQLAHNSVYYIWFELGRFSFAFDVLKFDNKELNTDILLPVVKSQCKYLAPIKLGDKLLLETRMHVNTSAKVRFYYTLLNARNITVRHAIGKTEHALVKSDGKLYLKFPEHIKEIFINNLNKYPECFLTDEEMSILENKLMI